MADQSLGTVYVPARSDGPDADAIAQQANRSILQALISAGRKHGMDRRAVEDGDKRALTYKELIRAAAALSQVIKRQSDKPSVAIMLPSSVAATVAYFAVLAAGRAPAMLNFTAGRATMAAACEVANADTILTANRFLKEAKLEDVGRELGDSFNVLPLEELRKKVSWRDKAFAAAALPLGLLPKGDADDAAALVFTSGSEGDPKAVVLTHRNILSNVAQVEASVPLERVKVIFNPLPVFHSYGLGPGVVLPLVTGRTLVVHPSPLRAKEVAQRVAETQANVLLATDTFLRQYLRAGDPESLKSLQYAVCGAERVRAETRDLARSRFGFHVLEGYGVTETSPVLAVNHPDDVRDGTVGRLFPGIEARLEQVDGMEEGQKLLVRGPNVMKGYLQRDGSIVPPPDGWHDTGDVVAIEDGHIAIRGRLKRFAKIGGEMTSLVTVENIAGATWPEALHAAAVVPGGRKGEQIVLLTEEAEPDPSAFLEELRRQGLTERFVPARIVPVDAIPLLGTGKTNFPAVTKIAVEAVAQPVG